MDIFSRLAPFIQDFIYLNNWTHLRAVQVAAADIIFNTENNLLLAASTASGKTEAAFFPILTLLHEKPSTSVGALYIGPLKALINDQFLRLYDLCENANIPVWRWHGDVAQNRKEKLLNRPSGILQITPESLEAILIRRHTQLHRLFHDLRFVVIDEVHSLLRGERGGQTLCCLERLSRIAQVKPRRIGLSATIGDPDVAAEYLGMGSGRATSVPEIVGPPPKWRLAVGHFPLPDVDALDKRTGKEKDTFLLDGDDGLKFLYEQTKGRKCLIFANSREECEVVTKQLRDLCEKNGESDRFLIHHGNLSTEYREIAESAMRDENEKRSTVTTSTLELGIDIGRLERVFQLDAPFSVASFLQRLGRSGRRGSPPEMSFVIRESVPSAGTALPLLFPWELLQAIALVQLYREERFVEPPRLSHVPYSLLYHQTLSTVAAEGELHPGQLAGRVLSLSYFKNVPQDEYKEILRYCIASGALERSETGTLVLGELGEHQTHNYKFYAVFKENEEYMVKTGSETLGTIVNPPDPGEKVAIAGRIWLVDDIDYKRHIVLCSPTKSDVVLPNFGPCAGAMHTRILERMKGVLCEEIQYPYLMPNAKMRLQEGREFASIYKIQTSPLISMGESQWALFPWLGTYAFMALERFLTKICGEALGISKMEYRRPYYMTFYMEKCTSEKQFYKVIARCSQSDFDPMQLLAKKEIPMFEKYDEFIPPRLVRKGFAYHILDREGMRKRIQEWQQNASV